MLVKARPGVWCDYCKDQWGKQRINGVEDWHYKAKRQAVVTHKSETHKKHQVIRSLCQMHVNMLSTWVDGSTWLLEDQEEYARRHRIGYQLPIEGIENGI